MAIGSNWRRWGIWNLVLYLNIDGTIADHSIQVGGAVAKAYPDSPSWPSLQDWADFNTTIGGKLIRATVPTSACIYGATYDAQACAAFQKNVVNASWIGEHATLTNWPQYLAANDCANNASSCDIAKAPSYILRATGPEEISKAMRWAAAKNVRVVIKNSGHDFLGRNVGYGALSIWTRHVRGIEWIDNWNGTTNRTDISGLWKGKAIKYGAGYTWGDVSEVATKKNHFVVTGAESTVGAGGGWLLGGGHGPYSNKYGLGVEQVLEFEIVTPTGEILTTSEVSHPDLFWALRGGGASTYGIVTRVTYKTYENAPQSVLFMQITPKSKSPADQETYYKAMAYFLTTHANMTDFGLSGYPMLSKAKYNGLFIAPGISFADLWNFLQPITKQLKKEGVSVQYLPIGGSVVDALTWLGSNYQGGSFGDTAAKLSEPCGFPFAMGSRLLSRKGLSKEKIPAITEMLKSILENENAFILPYPNMPGRSRQNRAWDFGLNPAWKTSVLHLIAVWNEGVNKRGIGDTGIFSRVEQDREVKVRQMQKVVTETWIPALDALSENHGAYINEGSPYEKDWKTTFYGGGGNYERLLGVKKKYDPKNTLWCFPCVGGDVFQEGDDGKLYHTS